MNGFVLLSMAGVLAMPAVFPAAFPSESSLRKCRETPNGIPVNVTEPILVVDGRIVGPLNVRPDGAQSRVTLDPRIAASPDDVVQVEIVCLEVTEGGAAVARAALAVITRQGAVGFMQSHLESLVQLQDRYHATHGTYAPSLTALAFFTSRAPLPITLTSSPDSWQASVQLNGVNTACRVGAVPPREHGAVREKTPVTCGEK